ncbi:hypothetical protein A3K34_00600 [candidate division WWE3 bacterium RIFOXYC1_FULL_40_10]|nr:MAG: hypothetical protein A3K58_00600 [candidate division WWE3 bacterium RIFOXYB1_FULL_40_22]OGC61380.1 MAG: hypothetical protein A3K37_00600 [candidate division WWE3 bacterium RIFOXYA1_FULL_40_11]OGC65763.1 MAG: hypothetical protein A3K34_00600 [candidate division WWE3 bacterium RIFOXYC1_FULL_40_10]OGC66997.1 MAG: hypothetical protein A2450_03945 [candidate division WWE3 bacterium RIFOXYC2_FULL_40_11]HLD51319.1 DNA-protecting protein DprA [Patescibacteria group bacterium]
MTIPSQLLKIRPKVQHLYYRGEYDESIFNKCIAVVGSRRMTAYGKRVLEKIIPCLVEEGVTIVSGYMYGTDKEAHKITLDCGGKTIAVLGWGIDWNPEVPSKNLLFVSEYPNDLKPQLWMFPKRNRIVAGLSLGVIVIEASEDSGSLITADMAKKFGRKVFCIPGPITSTVSKGSNTYIRDGLASIVTDVNDITQFFNWKIAEKHPSNGKQLALLDFLDVEPLTMDEISEKMCRKVSDVSAELSLLQLKGEVIEEGGKYYVSKG